MKAIKNLALVSVMTALGITGAWAQPVPTQPPPAAPPATNAVGAKIQVENPLYDFGRVKSGEPVKHTYTFTNTGDEVLQIKAVQPQCGCTAAGEWTKEVAPGKTGTIAIQFNSTGYNGPVFKQVTVTCNVSNQPIVMLQLKGTVFKQIDINPAFVALTVPADATSATMTVTITNNSDEFVTLAPPESNNKVLMATLTTNMPGKAYSVLIHTTDPVTPGAAQAQITMKCSLTNMPVVTVPVYVNVQPPVVVIPGHVTVQAPPLAAGVTNSVTIQNNSTNALTLSDPKINLPGISVELKEMQPGRMFTALIGFPQGFEAPPGQTIELTIKSSNPKMPLLKIPVSQIPRPTKAALPNPGSVPSAPGAPATARAAANITPPPLPPGK
jgi:hypothetical protein